MKTRSLSSAAKRKGNPQGEIEFTDQAIDSLVYHLCGLTEVEIKFVEEQ